MKELLGSVWRIGVRPFLVGLGMVVLLMKLGGQTQTGPQLNPYTQLKSIPVQAMVFFWQIGQTMPPSCNQNLPGGTPGPPLYSFAVVQAPAAGSGIGDKLYIAMMGSQGTCEWVPWLTAP